MNSSAAAVRTRAGARATLRSLWGGSIGNLVEWYDWFTYSALSLYFAPAFFPSPHQAEQLLAAAGVFAFGFLARPLGGWLLGRYADRQGRRPALKASMMAMGIGSLLIAAVPSYSSIGLAAPAILLAARTLQGLSVGGEYAASATYLAETAPVDRRGVWGSLLYSTMILGQLLAMLVLLGLQLTCSSSALFQWGWRIPFAIGAALAAIALRVLLGVDESEAFALQSRQKPLSTWTVIRLFPRQMLLVLGLTAGGSLAFYIYTSYAQKFLTVTSGFSIPVASRIATAALAFFMLLQPLVGWISDRVGRRPLLIAFGALGTFTTYPLLSGLATARSATSAFVLLSAGLIVTSLYSAISGLYKAELFPVKARALGVGLPYAISLSAVGGTAEYVGLRFKQAGFESGFYTYVCVFMAIAWLCAWRLPRQIAAPSGGQASSAPGHSA